METKVLKQSILTILIFVASQMLFGLAAQPFQLMFGSTFGNTIVLLTVASGIVSILLSSLFFHNIDFKESIRIHAKMDKKNIFLCVTAIVGALCGIFATNIMSELINLPDLMEDQFIDMSKSITGMIGIGIIAPIIEEYIFREAVEGQMLRSSIKPWKAILISACAFGLIHFNPAQVPFAVIVGIILGILYYKTRNILLCSIVHIINNSTAIVQMSIYGDNSKDIRLTDMLGGAEPALCYMIISGIVCIYFLRRFCSRYTTS